MTSTETRTWLKARLLLAQVDAHRELSTSLAHDDARVAA
jgi:hypothetical protein